MVLPIIAPATLVLIGGLIRLIAWLGSIVFIAMYARDAITKSKEADIQLSTDDTVDNIIGNPNLTPEQKTELLRKYLEGIKDDKPTDWKTIVMLLGGLAVGAFLLKDVLGGKK